MLAWIIQVSTGICLAMGVATVSGSCEVGASHPTLCVAVLTSELHGSEALRWCHSAGVRAT